MGKRIYYVYYESLLLCFQCVFPNKYYIIPVKTCFIPHIYSTLYGLCIFTIIYSITNLPPCQRRFFKVIQNIDTKKAGIFVDFTVKD